MSAVTDQIIAIVSAAVPKFSIATGVPLMDPAYYSLGILPPAIDKALAAGKTVQQIASAIESMVRAEGWVRATGEFSDTDLLASLGLIGSKPKPGRSAAEIKADASNGANIWEAQNGSTFVAVDGHVCRPGDPDHAAQVALLVATYPPTPAVAPAPGPTGPGGSPTGGPGIGA